MVARLIGTMHLNPAPDWKGRVVNALGEPIDDRGRAVARRNADPHRPARRRPP